MRKESSDPRFEELDIEIILTYFVPQTIRQYARPICNLYVKSTGARRARATPAPPHPHHRLPCSK